MINNLSSNKCFISNTNTNLIYVKYNNSYLVINYKYKDKFKTLLKILLENQDINININNIIFTKYTKDLIQNYYNIDLHYQKYQKILKKYNINTLSLILNKYNLSNQDNKILGNILFEISLWI